MKNTKWIIIGIAMAIFGLVGLVFTVAADEQEQAVAAPAPTVTKTVEVPGPTVTETVEVEGDNSVCVQALDAGDAALGTSADGFELATQALGLAGEGFAAIGEFDFIKLESVTADVERVAVDIDNLTPVMQQRMADYQRLSAECRSS